MSGKSSARLLTLSTPVEHRNVELRTLDSCSPVSELVDFFRGLPAAGLTSAAIDQAVGRFGLSRATLFRRYRQFQERPQLSTLINHRKPHHRSRHITAEQERIVEDVRKRFFKQYPEGSLVKLGATINGALAAGKLPQISQSTVRRRWRELSEQERFSARNGKRAGREKHGLLRGHTPTRSFPLERVQIDHTLCDIELVHPETGEPIGRPWITIVLDEFSRAALSFILSFEAPSSTTVALALARAVSPKDKWLLDLELGVPWPFAGVPSSIYTDNGSDFCSKAMADGCAEWGIPKPEKRPKGEPQYGGIIERIIGTVMKETAMLPGAIARQVSANKDKRSARKSTMTIEDYERHLAEWFHGYHKRTHATLGVSPAAKWDNALCGQGGRAIPAPRVITDTRKFFIDFLPSTTRQLKRYGFTWDRVFYRSDNLDFFARRDPTERFVIRRNPLDIRRIFVWHAEEKRHYEVMAEDPLMPRTLFYLRLAKAHNVDHAVAQTTDNIVRSYEHLLDAERSRSTRKGRKVAQRNDERQRRSDDLTRGIFGADRPEEAVPEVEQPVVATAPRVRPQLKVTILR